MLKLTKTESLIVNELRKWPRTKAELEEVIDHAKTYSESYISKTVNAINWKRKIIITPSEWNWTHFELTENNIEYKIITWLEEIKALACATCVHKAKTRETFILAGISFIIGFLFAFFVSWFIIEVETEFNIIQDCKNNIVSIEPNNLDTDYETD